MKSLTFAILALIIPMSLMAIMPKYSDSHLAETSDIIVIAEVVSEGRTEFIEGHNTCTPWRIEIDRYIKGSGPMQFDFYTQGGQIPNSSNRLWVEDQALPKSGQKALIFLEELECNWFVNGLFQGYRTIVGDEIENIPLPEYSDYISRLARSEKTESPRRRPGVTASPMSITGLNPITGLAGDGTITLVISGSGFGSSTGTVEFTYYQWTGYDPTYLDPSWTTIHSWTDSEIHTDIAPHASSGPIRVTPTSGPALVSPMDFNVTFGYHLNLWPPATPVNITLTHNDATYPCTGCPTAIQNALNTWSTAGAWFRYFYGATTTDDDSDFDGGENGNNSIHFGIFPGSSPPLGICQIYMGGWPDMYIYEMDIRFNNDYPWSTGDPVTQNDVESIMLHESGHGLQLLDVYGIADLGEVMFGVYTTGDTRRTLSTDDNDGIIYIYGADPTDIGEVREATGTKISLSPSPAKDNGHIDIELATESNVRIEIIDISGRIISVVFDGVLNAGANLIPLNIGNSLPNGIYFAKVNTGREIVSEKLIILK